MYAAASGGALAQRSSSSVHLFVDGFGPLQRTVSLPDACDADGGGTLPVHTGSRRGGMRAHRWRRNRRLLLLGLLATLLLPTLQLLAARRAERLRDAGDASGAAPGRGARDDATALLSYARLQPRARRRAFAEPTCAGVRSGGAAHVPADKDASAGPAGLTRDDCFTPLNESDTAHVACECDGGAVELDFDALRLARGAGAEVPAKLLCARVCRKAWEATSCPPLAAAAAPPAVRLRAAGPRPGALFSLWADFEAAFRNADGLDVVRPPGARGYGGRPEVDWVARGEAMQTADVAAARAQWRGFVEGAPPYPRGLFAGRGIVTTGGGLRYMVPVWVSINMLRRAGCTLPIEVWFFDNEMPAPDAAAALRQRGVLLRNVDEIRANASREIFKYGRNGFGFVMKAAIMLFSSFEESIYMDSDNVALSNPTDLFDFEGYKRTGMVLWPDYWAPSVAPDLFRIAPEASPPGGTVESGQMVIHKRRCWRALLLTLFLNCQGSLYYNLLTNYMGVGDKETFPIAMRMLQLPYHAVGEEYPVGSAGFEAPPRRRKGTPSGERGLPALRSTCMVQYHPGSGALLLFHSNLNKWSLNVPTQWRHYQRRWQFITPPKWRFVAHHDEPPPLLPIATATSALGYDVERACWEVLVRLRCEPWFERYIQGQSGGAGDVERVFEYAPGGAYNAFVLDDHMTGVYEPAEEEGDGIEDAARERARGGESGGAGMPSSGRGDDAAAADSPRRAHRRARPPPAAGAHTALTPEVEKSLEESFLSHQGHVMQVFDMEALAARAGLDLVTLYIWWDGRSKTHADAAAARRENG